MVKCLMGQIYHNNLTLKIICSGSMRDLTAQVTSGLLKFPEVTIQALGEDEITLESVLRGKFAAGKIMLLKTSNILCSLFYETQCSKTNK